LADEHPSVSLIEQLGETGFRSALIATYSCYFPFFEEVILRRLITAGCTHNVLLVDAARCAEAFKSDELRPRRAGHDYTLIPVSVPGAFHPKVVLRLGKSKGSLFIGSHNATLAGFGLNDELTNVFRAEGAALRSRGEPLRRVVEFLSPFVPPSLPELSRAYDGLREGIPWMQGPLPVTPGQRVLVTGSPTGEDLWAQLRPLVPERVRSVFVCGPFYDAKLEFYSEC
jgi:hypothetical protein